MVFTPPIDILLIHSSSVFSVGSVEKLSPASCRARLIRRFFQAPVRFDMQQTALAFSLLGGSAAP